MSFEAGTGRRPAGLQECWEFDGASGFLIAPDPVTDLRTVESGLSTEAAGTAQELSDALPTLLREGRLRAELDEIPAISMAAAVDHGDGRVVERLLQVYAHLANVYVWCDQSDPARRLPVGVAVPLVELAQAVERPPILAYASTSLANFERIDATGDLCVDNLRCVQELIKTPDEAWFHLLHVEIEWHGAAAVSGCLQAQAAAHRDDLDGMVEHLAEVPAAFDRMITSFKRIGEGCSPDYYFRTLRPYLFGFTDVIYTGVTEFGDQPQTFRGESGAQSSVIPAVQRLLGLRHSRGGLTVDLEAMIDHMPIPHRTLLREIDTEVIRARAVGFDDPDVRDAYNACLQGVLDFRSLHVNMARAYVASRVEDPTGTGGTEFMGWLTQLRDETKEQIL